MTSKVRIPITKAEEEENLKQVVSVAEDNLERVKNQIEKSEQLLLEIQNHYTGKDKEIQVIWNNAKARYYEENEELKRCEKALKDPYFGRIDIVDSEKNYQEGYYIGKVGIAENISKLRVIDWRTPLASLYYENQMGRCEYEVKGEKTYKVDVQRKRTYEIKEQRLFDFYDSDVVANDELLTKYLAKNKQNILHEIIATIQQEQNEIIRKSPKLNLIVQGAAGSGKTTVAMHRISYILYNYKEFRPEDFYIIGRNQVLLNYITKALPDLDVYGVKQMTMEQLFVRLLYQEWDAQQFSIKKFDDKLSNIKTTETFFSQLKSFCDDFEKQDLLKNDIIIEKTKIIILEKEKIEDCLTNYPGLSMAQKIKRLNDMLSARLDNEITGKHVSYSSEEKEELQKKYKHYFGKEEWKESIFEFYEKFLHSQVEKGISLQWENNRYDCYDLAALAYIYKRMKEIDPVREAAHVIVDEAQDFGMMIYYAMEYCLRGCTYTIMGDLSQNILPNQGLETWKPLRELLLKKQKTGFSILKKSYRNTIQISSFATNLLCHGDFPVYPIDPLDRNGTSIACDCQLKDTLFENMLSKMQKWTNQGYSSIAVICRSVVEAEQVERTLKEKIELAKEEEFQNGISVIAVEESKGLEFDCVYIYDPSIEKYPLENLSIRLLYVACTRALHELSIGCMSEKHPFFVPVSEKEKNLIYIEEQTSDENHQKEKRTRESFTPIVFSERKRKRPSIKNDSTYKFGTLVEEKFLKRIQEQVICKKVITAKKGKQYIECMSNDGVLRLTPITEQIIRIQFWDGDKIPQVYWDTPAYSDVYWKALQSKSHCKLQLKKFSVMIDKLSGALRFMSNDGKTMLAEEKETFLSDDKGFEKRVYFHWTKEEILMAKGILDQEWIKMQGKARYISFGNSNMRLPLLWSEKGYGIAVAADQEATCCHIQGKGTYISLRNQKLTDYYFIIGSTKEEIVELYRDILF